MVVINQHGFSEGETVKIASCRHAVTVLPMQEESETEAAGPTLPLVPSALVIIPDGRIPQ